MDGWYIWGDCDKSIIVWPIEYIYDIKIYPAQYIWFQWNPPVRRHGWLCLACPFWVTGVERQYQELNWWWWWVKVIVGSSIVR